MIFINLDMKSLEKEIQMLNNIFDVNQVKFVGISKMLEAAFHLAEVIV